jgi:hypothetical protein
MSFNRRRIINVSTQFAMQDAKDWRDKRVQSVEDMREELGIKSGKMDVLLDRPESWYSNHVRGGTGSHEFMLHDFLETYFAVQWLTENDGEPPMDQLKKAGGETSDEMIQELESMREYVDISPRRIDQALDKDTNWWESVVSGEKDISLLSYYQTLILLESVETIYHEEEYVEPAAA